MSAEAATKPTVADEVVAAAVAETTPAEAAPAAAEEKPAEAAAEPAAEAATPAAEEEAKPAEKKEEKPAAKPVEPISEGSLKYKAPGLHISHFVPQKRYFWLGTDEAVTIQNLASYLRGEEPKIAQPTAAWASQTGKGLLFFAKTAEQKATPAHVFNLAEITDLEKAGIIDLSFKLTGEKKAEKHVLEASNSRERDGWLLALQAAHEEAKAKKEEILNSEGYKKAIADLGKPNTAAATPAAAVKDKAEAKGTETKVEAEAAVASAEKKSRSISRGKRGSVFGFLNKKEEAAKAEAEDKKPEAATEEAKPEEAAADAAPAAAAEATEAAEPAAEAAAATETAEAPKEEAAAPVEPTPRASKRASIFGGLSGRVQKLRSPSREKKEAEVVPAAKAEEPKAEETTEAVAAEPATAEAAAATETAPEAPAAEEPAKEAAVEAEKPAPAERKPSFISTIFKKSEKAKSPTTETAPAVTEEAAKPAEETATDAPAAEDTKVEDPVNGTTTTTEVTAAPAGPSKTEKRRSSFFGSLGGSVKKIGEKKAAETVKAAKEEPPKADEAEAAAPAAETAETAAPVAETTEAAVAAPATEEAAVAAPTEEKAAEETPAEEAKDTVEKQAEKTKSHVSKGFSGLGRNLSKMIKGSKDKSSKAAAATTEKGEASKPAEEVKPVEEKAAATEEAAKPAEEAAPAVPEKKEETPAIGDVTAESVTVSDPPPAVKTVQATA